MAARENLGREELNFIFKSLAERGADGRLYEKGNKFLSGVLLQYLTSKLEKTENFIVIKAYGSTAEGLTCYEPCDVGDVDIMIFPNSPELTIHEERLEYSLENPLHVRIRGDHQSALQPCLVEHTEYVATSAVKNFHPAIFGHISPKLVNFITRAIRVLSSLETLSPIVTAHLKNKKTSPALTLNLTQSLGTISHICKIWDNSLLISKETVSGASLMDEDKNQSKFLASLETRCRRKDELGLRLLLMLVDELSQQFFSRGEEISSELQDIESRSQNKAKHSDLQSLRTKTNNKDDEIGSSPYTCFDATSLFNDGSSVTVTTQRCGDVSPQSILPRDSKEIFSPLPDEPMSKQATEHEGTEGKSGEKNGGDSNESKYPLKSEQQKRTQLPSKELPSHPDAKREIKTIKHKIRTMYNRLVENLFGAGTQTEETEFRGTDKVQFHDRVKFGMDIVPALKTRGWPEVAREWISRDRKWPSPDIVNKVIQEGFQLVVKPPKINGNPDCDFRISFSHAEYLLSQAMNRIQRECYRGLKRLHRAYLSTQPASLVTFHLKNIFLQTIEETGTEKWIESNRADCMIKLLGNLLKALRNKYLRHFFVRSYNLFGVDYIEDPTILESLAWKVEQIMCDPVRFSKQLIRNQEDTGQINMNENVPEGNVSNDEAALFAKTVAAQRDKGIKEISCLGNYDNQRKKEKKAEVALPTENAQRGGIKQMAGGYRCHGLNDIIYEIIHKTIDHLYREINQVGEQLNDKMDSLEAWISSDPLPETRADVEIQGVDEEVNNGEDDLTPGNTCEEAWTLLERMLDPCDKNPFNLNHTSSCDAPSRVVDSTRDIPLD